MDTVQDTAAPQEYRPLPEVTLLVTELESLLAHIKDSALSRAPQETLDALPAAIELLKQGEPFHPEPHSESGQGKWKELAAQMARNADFYQGIVRQVGEILGKEAYTSDDGSVQDSVLALKVPELVKALKDKAERQAQFNGPQ